MNPFDLTKTNPFNLPNSNNDPRKIVPNPFLSNNSIGPSPHRTDNLGLNNSIQQNTYINDVVHVVVDSRERNIVEFPLPNDYTIEFARPFNTVKEISLANINISNTIPPVNIYNNNIVFEYPTTADANKITNILLPDTTSLSDDKLFFGTQIKEGFYNTISLARTLESALSQIKHLTAFDEVIPCSNHNFKVDINPETQLVQIVNRIESIPIYAIQTILLDPTDDIFAIYRVGPVPIPAVFDDAFLIMIRKDFADSYPLVITDSAGVGNIDPTRINWQTYFLYTLAQPYTYEKFDELLIGGITYYRFKLSFPGLMVSASENKIFTMVGGQLETILIAAGIFDFVSDGVNRPTVGRALPVRFIYHRSQVTEVTCKLNSINEDGSINTILELLGWNVKNNDLNADITAQFQYINTNHGSYLTPEISFSSFVNGYDYSLQNNLLRLEFRDNLYWFRSEDYIFLKLIINDDQAELGNKLVIAGPVKDEVEDAMTQIFYNVKPNGRIADAHRLQMKNTTNLFAKIDLELLAGNTRGFIRHFVVHNIHFKNEQLDSLSQIRIQFVDRKGRLLHLRSDHNFVLEIVTKRNVLDNILMNTKNG